MKSATRRSHPADRSESSRYGQPRRQARLGEQDIPGRLPYAQPPLLPLDGEPSPNQCANDCLPAHEILNVTKKGDRALRILEPEEQPAADDRTGDRRRCQRPPILNREVIATRPALMPVGPRRNGVCEQLEDEMRMHVPRADANPVRKRHAPALAITGTSYPVVCENSAVWVSNWQFSR